MSRDALTAIAGALACAKCPEDIFGGVATEAAVQHAYRALVVDVHPDHYPEPAEKAEAEETFRALTALKHAADAKLAAGTYGDRAAPLPAPPPPTAAPTLVTVRGKQYLTGARVAHGELSTLYEVTDPSSPTGPRLVLKIADSARDNDLLENESRVLKALVPAGSKREGFLRYLPTQVDSFKLRSTKSIRHTNIFRYHAERFSLAEVQAQYPNGLDFRDVAWMFRRMLEGLGHVHRQGYVHGAIIPEHVLVHPVSHGAVLVDWCYAVEADKAHIRAVSPFRCNFYPEEVFQKKKATPAVDIYMAATCAMFLLGSPLRTVVPPPLYRFLEACYLSAARRPHDAWALHEELGEILKKLVGPPEYRKLAMHPRVEA